jgi:ABC-type uncharacterized transport system fused permease/ATPase subunit
MGATLLETICYPKDVKHGDEGKVKILLNKAGLSSLADRLQERSDFTKTISGGQKKAIKVISAILHRPDILLLDETLTGLDSGTCETIQTLIKKNLPNATVLVVDHTIEANNRLINGKKFYDEVLEFANQTITKTSLSR